MNNIRKKPLNQLGNSFIPEDFLPDGKDEYYIRNKQLGESRGYRSLKAHEIEVLVKNDNSADDWNNIMVSDRFDPHLVKNNRFFGLIRIGNLESYYLEFHDIPLPVGIYNSKIIACDLGSNVSINNVNLLAHYIIEDEVILQNIDEMLTTNYAKFGNGIVKDGEDEDVRIWIEVANENGGRNIIPFTGMTAGDAWLWSRYRDRQEVLAKLKTITQERYDSRRGYYGRIGTRTVINHCRILKDVNVGSDAYIKGCNKLKNITVNSSAESQSQIGEGVELVNGIIGYGCHIFYGVKAVRFIMDDYTNLKYGARLINSFLGNNSTISCCEVLNALIYPGHEQHHNSSFLIASTILGQSNMASGATIGSNHNSRGNDGEILAGRGFWPGLSTSMKHNSRFASFNLIATGTYSSEINNPLPFSLISNDKKSDCLVIIPAYWFRYNMYALARNAWKYGARDRRKKKKHLIIFDYLAPDTINEIFDAMDILRDAVEHSSEFKNQEKSIHDFLCSASIPYINADWMESGKREVRLLKPCESYREYRDMILFYGMKTLASSHMDSALMLKKIIDGGQRSIWENVGGQLIKKSGVRKFLNDIENGVLNSWDEIHDYYKGEAKKYPKDLRDHALASIKELLKLDEKEETADTLKSLIKTSIEINRRLADRCFESRKKDYSNPFRQMTYANDEERDAVIGKLEDNGFIRQTAKDADELEELLNDVLQEMIS